MCIVSFYKQNEQILLTHNRDESIYRSASPVVEHKVWEGKEYYAPVDQEKQGTWIFYSEEYIACILNGGKERPQQVKPSYKKSRGIVLLNLMKYNHVSNFCNDEDFNGIAPFTIVVHELKNKKTYVLFWDEKELECNDLSDRSFIFRGSTTLYSYDKMKEVENIFPKFNSTSPEEIFSLHNAIKMKDGDIAIGKATTSITQIFSDSTKISMKYCPLF